MTKYACILFIRLLFRIIFYVVIFIPFFFLADTNRIPFCFAEGQSELVSGFHVDYGGGGFVLIFFD